MRFGLRARLVLWLVGANIAVLVASMFITDQLVRSAMQTEPDWPALGQAVLAQYERRDPEALRRFGEEQHRHGVDIHLFLGDNDLLDHPVPPHLARYLPQLLAADAPLVLKAGDWQWLGSVPLLSTRGEHLRLVALRVPRPPHERRAAFLLSQLLLSGLVISALGLLVARSLARPIAGLQQVVRRMADGDLAVRTADSVARRSDEIGALARDFDHMAARTEKLVHQQRAVLQDVSHELRSPLARLHILLELARQGANADAQAQLQRAEGEITRLDELIGEVLDLSRMEAALPGLALQPLSLPELLRRLVDGHGIEAEARRLRLLLRLHAMPSVQGDAALLLRALGNVLGNAIKFSAEGGAIDISLEAAYGQALVIVRDYGPGVPSGNLATLFQPFYRGDNAALAEGHGLGLAIAQRVIGAHAGSISASNAEGGGLRVEIRLPLAT